MRRGLERRALPLTSGLVAEIFGVRYLSMLGGFVFLSHQVGSFLGVWLGGRLYDMTGSYDVVWWIAIERQLAGAARRIGRGRTRSPRHAVDRSMTRASMR